MLVFQPIPRKLSPGAPDGTFPKPSGFISVHLVGIQEEAFGRRVWGEDSEGDNGNKPFVACKTGRSKSLYSDELNQLQAGGDLAAGLGVADSTSDCPLQLTHNDTQRWLKYDWMKTRVPYSAGRSTTKWIQCEMTRVHYGKLRSFYLFLFFFSFCFFHSTAGINSQLVHGVHSNQAMIAASVLAMPLSHSTPGS